VQHDDISPVLTEIGQRIQARRLEIGLTQDAAAHRAEIDYKRWQRLEQGTVNATVRTLVRVAQALEVSLWVLLAPEDGSRSQ